MASVSAGSSVPSAQSPASTDAGAPLVILLILAVALAYLVAGKLGLQLATAAPQVSAVWPAAGIALAAVLLGGNRVAPGVLIAAFIVNATSNEPLATSAGIAIGNTLEALAGAWLLRRLGFNRSLRRIHDVLVLAVAAALSPVISSSMGVVSLCAGGVHPWSAFVSLWDVWWLGDTMGDIVVAPLLLVWAGSNPHKWRIGRAAEALALATGLSVVSLASFLAPVGLQGSHHPLHYTMFPFVVWAALRFRQLGATAVTFIASTFAIWATVHGPETLVASTAQESLVHLQLFLAILAATGLLLGAAMCERSAAERRARREVERLGESEERLRLALASGNMGVWDWNIRTGEVRWSENLELLHGVPEGTFSSALESFSRVVHPDDREYVEAKMGHAVACDSAYDIEFRTLTADGSVRWIAAKGTVLRDASGEAVRMLGVATDVTARRLLADELAARAAQLAESDRRKDEFLAMLAHELRNPLSALSNAVHLMRTDARENTRSLDTCDRQVRQLARLVDDLLDVSRITRGKIALQTADVLLADVLEAALETVRDALSRRGLELHVSLPPYGICVGGDAARLEQVFSNLLSNAVKYTAQGGNVWLSAELRGEQAIVKVRDDGAGISREFLPYVFDLFAQADASLERASGGLGIGLTIVRRLVEMHGGRVEVDSGGAGRGSTFTVMLPARDIIIRAPVAGPALSATRERVRILLVEDNKDAADTLGSVLELWGHEVHIAYDGTSALVTAETVQPDVILSDLGLPGMNGFELARELRRRSLFRDVLLVALSGYGRDEDRQRAIDAGFDQHLVKPANLQQLSELLAHVVPRRRSTPVETLH